MVCVYIYVCVCVCVCVKIYKYCCIKCRRELAVICVVIIWDGYRVELSYNVYIISLCDYQTNSQSAIVFSEARERSYEGTSFE